MKNGVLILSLVGLISLAACGGKGGEATTSAKDSLEPVAFDDFFYDKTMRFDFYHCGNATDEYYLFDEVIEEPYWGGSKVALVDEMNRGVQYFKIIDKASGRVIYSKGYCTLFNEWQDSDEAQTINRAMPEGVTFPYPKNDVRIEIYSRNKRSGEFEQKYSYDIDVNSYFIRHFTPTKKVVPILNSGDPQHKVDIVILPDGFTEEEYPLFERVCQEFLDYFFSYYPYSEHMDDFNINAVWLPSHDSGISIPGDHLWKETALMAHYYTFDSERYQMVDDYQMVLDAAANVPYDLIYILTNSTKYGGGGIYNFYAVSAALIPGENTRKTYSHEFTHLFTGAADEYVGGQNLNDFYPVGVEPWEDNLTTLVDFDSKVWKSMLDEDAEIPTPVEDNWALNPQNHDAAPYNPDDPWKLGVYEGGGYLEEGIYRPWPNCMMNWFHTIDIYCPVCCESIERTIGVYCE